MAPLNKVLLIGNLVKDPKLTIHPDKGPDVELELGVTRRWVDKSGESHTKLHWFTCKAQGKRAEILAKHTRKGSRLFVDGSLETTGDKRRRKQSGNTVVISDFQMLDPKSTPAAPTEEARTEETGEDGDE